MTATIQDACRAFTRDGTGLALRTDGDDLVVEGLGSETETEIRALVPEGWHVAELTHIPVLSLGRSTTTVRAIVREDARKPCAAGLVYAARCRAKGIGR